MSTVADSVKPAEEFVVFTDDSPTTPREDKTNAAPPTTTQTLTSDSPSLDNTISPPSATRIDSFPKTLPLPASSILSPVSAAREQPLLPLLSEQRTPPGAEGLVSTPEKNLAGMLVQTAPFPHTDHTGTSTPLAELAGTEFDQQVALRRRGDSILGEEISEGVSKLNVEAENTTPVVKEISLPPREVFTAEELAARKNNPAVVSAPPQTPSAEDFEVAKTQTGANFTPEFTETRVAL